MAGGLLIGIAALGMILVLGRIAGISGIFWSAIVSLRNALPNKGSQLAAHWRWFFLLGLVAAPLLLHKTFAIAVPAANPAGHLTAMVAGLLVGIGTVLGSGCSSGHGVCGIGRLSLRSVVATLLFMSTATITVFINRHLF
ncbi:MAG: YeeE/YedE family protein [Pseudomonadales bacterium]|nr:YeeE/YedE family protein [Pseudomonadales bacterium]